MKRLILIIGMALLSVIVFAQRPFLAPTGIKIGRTVPGTSIILVDSLTQQSTDQFVIWKGATVLAPYIPEGHFKIGTTTITPTATQLNTLSNVKTYSTVQDQLDSVKIAQNTKADTSSVYSRSQTANLTKDSINAIYNYGVNLEDSVIIATVKTVTLAASATTMLIHYNNVIVTGDAGGNTITTIIGAHVGIVILLFTDANVTITDTDANTANTINLSSAFTSANNTTLTLFYNGVKYFELTRSTN